MTQVAIFDMDEREGDPGAVHVLMPNMAYVCGGNILTKAGSFRCGTSAWDEITCPSCRACGREALAAEVARQQGRGPACATVSLYRLPRRQGRPPTC